MKEKNNDMNFFDRFLYKLFIGFLLLLAIVMLDYFKVVSYDDVKSNMDEHFNVLKLIKKINGNMKIIPIEFDESVAVDANIYKNHKLIDNKYYIDLEEYEAVENYSLGVVISISKESNAYKVKVLSDDGTVYLYEGLENVNCHLYQCLNTKEIIGKASYDKITNKNHFYFSAFNDKGIIYIYGE